MRSQYTNAFTSITGVPATALVASDKQNNNYFYAAYASTVYVSSNNGQTFVSGGSISGASQINYVTVHPKVAGQVYVGTDAGIYLSTNFGSSFTLLSSSLTNIHEIALGLGSGSTWYLYAFGTGPSGNKLYGSADNGKTWTDLQGSQSFGAISSCRLAGSGNVAGQVYVGTNGRGVFYAKGTIAGGSTPSTSSTSTSRSTTLGTSTTATLPSTTATPTTLRTTTTSSQAATSSAASCTVPQYYQCGGSAYTGCTTCASGYTCVAQNTFYSQCL